jgi:hypothetical protein
MEEWSVDNSKSKQNVAPFICCQSLEKTVNQCLTFKYFLNPLFPFGLKLFAVDVRMETREMRSGGYVLKSLALRGARVEPEKLLENRQAAIYGKDSSSVCPVRVPSEFRFQMARVDRRRTVP